MATHFLEATARDVRHAARMATRYPSFTAVAVLSLALGIGPTVAVFTVLDAALLNPLPYDEPGQLIAVQGTSPHSTSNPVSSPNYQDWRDRAQSVEELAGWRLEMFTLTAQPQAERLIGGRVSANYFRTLRVQPLIGRTFNDEED